MKQETKQCQNCKQDFTIESEDFNFYEKIKVPPPTFCPECRMIRRLMWRNQNVLFRRNCDKTGEPLITMFHPEANIKIYEHNIWWGDSWDPCAYGKEYDFSKSFFEQYKELLSQVPLMNLGNNNCVNSLYGNHNLDCKNCYLVSASFKNEDLSYSQGAVNCKNCVDTYSLQKSEECYEDTLCDSLYQTHFSYNSDQSLNSWFLKNCVNCSECIGCINLHNKKNCIFNKQYTKEEYEKLKEELDFGSYEKLLEFKNKYSDFVLKYPHKYANILKSFDSTGDNIMNAKNAKYCFDIFGDMENSKYSAHGVGSKDTYDCYGFGGGAELLYEGADTGLKASNQYFAVLTHSCLNTDYTYMCFNSKNLFGCIGLRKKEYCILNKQYSKESFEELRTKIIKQMQNAPYIDSKGRCYSYGEFFPSEISPFAYNETIAQEYYPKEEKQIIKEGFLYRKPNERNYKTTLNHDELPDHIKEVEDSIVDEIIACPNKGNQMTLCTEAYRITKEELSFLRKNNIALPRMCPNCRHFERLKKRNPMKLWHRKCMKEGCNNEFETSYAPERPEIIYCERCYQQEVY